MRGGCVLRYVFLHLVLREYPHLLTPVFKLLLFESFNLDF